MPFADTVVVSGDVSWKRASDDAQHVHVALCLAAAALPVRMGESSADYGIPRYTEEGLGRRIALKLPPMPRY